MTEYRTLQIKPGDQVRILSQSGDWTQVNLLGAAWAKETEQYEYPTTARRAFVNLAEAVRTIDKPKSLRRMLIALAGVHVDEGVRANLLASYVSEMGNDRQVIAERFAAILDNTHEKFHAGRFIYHAISDSTADDDGEGGKWSYNRTNPEDAQKTTIESVPEDGEGETVVL